MPGRWFASACAVLALSLLAGGRDGASDDGARAGGSVRAAEGRLIETVPARCAVGERPRYFVPSDIPPVLLGCARLGVSGKRVELSGSVSRVGRHLYFCVNPAYSGRGRRGTFIPALCKLDPPPTRFAVRDVSHPRQAVRRYELVIWGTAEGATTDVVARFDAGSARAAIFAVPSRRAPWSFGEPVPFGLYVVELPLSAACGTITVHADTPAATKRIPQRRKLCDRARAAA